MACTTLFVCHRIFKWQNPIMCTQYTLVDFSSCNSSICYWIQNLFISLQGLTTIVLEQLPCMSGLINTYCQMTWMLGPLTSEQIVSRSAKTPAAVSSSFFLSYDAACLYLENLGVWVLQSVDSLTIEDLDPLLKSVGQLFVDVININHFRNSFCCINKKLSNTI